MKLPWFRSDFLRRRQLDRVFLDAPDAIHRALTGRSDWPPLSLRSFVGGARNFGEAGVFFRRELAGMRLLNAGDSILDVGCGCGRIAYALAAEPELRQLDFRYVGMDIDRASIEWCKRHITARDSRFQFYHADCRNASYNPAGSIEAQRYRFPHSDSSFQLILLTSVLTHTLEDTMRNYIREAARMLAPRGVVYATFFLYESPEQLRAGIDRHEAAFPFVHGHYAVNREDHPENAVAYEERYVREVIQAAGLSVIEPSAYGTQDLLLLTKPLDAAAQVELREGWHDPEKGIWRWTKQSFNVHVRPSRPAPLTLELRFRLPDAILHQLGSIRLGATADGLPLPEAEYSSPGDHVYRQSLPSSLPTDGFQIRFYLNKHYGPKAPDTRELGVQVVFFAGCGAGFRELDPIRVE